MSTTYLGLSHHGGGAQAQIELIDSDPGVMVDIPNYTGTASIELRLTAAEARSLAAVLRHYAAEDERRGG